MSIDDVVKSLNNLKQDGVDQKDEDLRWTAQCAVDAINGLQRALIRQSENMAFILNRVDLHKWHGRFTLELEEDRKLLK